MDKASHDWQVVFTAFVVGTVIFVLLNWGPVAKRIPILEPKDPEKGLKIFFIIVIGLWVVVGIAMSIGILLKVLGVGG